VRASKNAAVSEMAAKRSPIGNATIFLTQRTRRERSSPRQALRRRRRSVGGGGPAGSPASATAPSSAASASPSSGPSVDGAAVAGAITSWASSSGGWGTAPIAWFCAAG
jgi:hypothetical protein